MNPVNPFWRQVRRGGSRPPLWAIVGFHRASALCASLHGCCGAGVGAGYAAVARAGRGHGQLHGEMHGQIHGGGLVECATPLGAGSAMGSARGSLGGSGGGLRPRSGYAKVQSDEVE